MTETSPPFVERLLRNDRRIVIAGLVVVTLGSWAFLVAGAGMGMSGIEMTRHSLMGMDMMSAARWSLPYAVLMFFMWWIMMIAMMLPSASPVVLLVAAINRRSDATQAPYGKAGIFAAGYLLAWAGFSILAVAAQWQLAELGLISGMLQTRSDVLTGVLLITAGAWQFTGWKRSCLRHCRNPAQYLARHRLPGNRGALFMGMQHGLYCLGCCWFLMALLFVGGVMNLVWVAGLAIYVWLEKMVLRGETPTRLMGVLLMAAGIGVLLL